MCFWVCMSFDITMSYWLIRSIMSFIFAFNSLYLGLSCNAEKYVVVCSEIHQYRRPISKNTYNFWDLGGYYTKARFCNLANSVKRTAKGSIEPFYIFLAGLAYLIKELNKWPIKDLAHCVDAILELLGYPICSPFSLRTWNPEQLLDTFLRIHWKRSTLENE